MESNFFISREQSEQVEVKIENDEDMDNQVVDLDEEQGDLVKTEKLGDPAILKVESISSETDFTFFTGYEKTRGEKLRELWNTPGASAKIDAQREKWKNKLPKEELLKRKSEKQRERRAKLREKIAPDW